MCVLPAPKREIEFSRHVWLRLPAERLTPNKPPFYCIGVDFFGPFTVRQARSYVKRYGCIFTCFASRAVHLEVAHALTVDSFINAYRRVSSRRGKVHTLYSDNGTNFVGAEKERRVSLIEWNQNVLHKQLCQRGVRWQFNPPLASHMGGIWERVIRSVKKILFALLSEQRLTDESLATLLTEMEYILNSRPLTPVVMDSECQEPHTPNHLLLASHEAQASLRAFFGRRTVKLESDGNRCSTWPTSFGTVGPRSICKPCRFDTSGKMCSRILLWTIWYCCTTSISLVVSGNLVVWRKCFQTLTGKCVKFKWRPVRPPSVDRWPSSAT